jgi:hypothetical protein
MDWENSQISANSFIDCNHSSPLSLKYYLKSNFCKITANFDLKFNQISRFSTQFKNPMHIKA